MLPESLNKHLYTRGALLRGYIIRKSICITECFDFQCWPERLKKGICMCTKYTPYTSDVRGEHIYLANNQHVAHVLR